MSSGPYKNILPDNRLKFIASLAQSVEHETFNLRAAGSSPAEGFSLFNNLFNRFMVLGSDRLKGL